MLNLHRLPNLDRVEREASEWIARLNADDVSGGDRARFEEWRTAHPMHARIYDEVAATWRTFTAAGPLVRAVSFGQSMNDAAKVRPTRRRLLYASAAAIAVMATALSWYALHRAPGTLFETAVGEHASISLADGSTLDLNSNSAARVYYSDRSRVVDLERGEAYFKVIHDAARPFWVVSDGTWVRDVGTAFNVDRRQDGVRVTVSEGTVEVGAEETSGASAPSDAALAQAPVSVVTAGQEVDMRGSAGTVRTLSAADIARVEAWRSGSVYFEKQALSEVVDELSRYTTLQLVVEDPKLRQLPVGGTFRANPQGAEAFLTMLKDGFGLRIRREGGRAYIESASASAVAH